MADQGKPTPPTNPTAGSGSGRSAEGLFQTRYREVTISAVVFGIVFGAIMNAAITYAGLKIGFTIVGSAIAAVLGFGVLRGILRRGSILETNIGQTVASAVNTTNAGVIFTVPVLLLLAAAGKAGLGDFELRFDSAEFWLITLACMAGAILGCVFIVPLRKQMLDIDRLRFPSATAVAAILKSPGAGPAKAVVLMVGIVVGAVVYLPAGLPQIKLTAPLERLDRLIERERITPAQAALTREIASWIEERQAPENLIAAGALMNEQRAIRVRLEEHEENSPQWTALHEVLERTQADIKAIGIHPRYQEELLVRAYKATQGELDWTELRSRRTGWALEPLPGYQDVQWRMPGEVDEERQQRRTAGETVPTVLTKRVDRNEDDRPDLVLTDNMVDVGRVLRLPDEIQLVFAIAPFAIGAGYLTGRAGLMVLAGGILAYMVLNPLAYNMGWLPATVQAHQVGGYALGVINRPLGIGLLLGGALMGVLVSLPAIREALRSVAAAGKQKAGLAGGSDELGLKPLILIGAAGMLVLLLAAELLGMRTQAAGDGGWLSGLPLWLSRAVLVLVAAAWIWFAGIVIAQCAGMTDWSPISGMALLTVVLVMLLSGTHDVLMAVLLGAALCVAISCASDMMGDLKTGYLVGAQPKRQQILEIATAAIGPVITMSTLVLIVAVNQRQFGIPIGPGTETVAPQAQALEAVITGVQGGEMPYALYGFGALLGIFLGLGAFPGLGVLVGLSIYLPIFYILTYGLGCIINMVVARIKGRVWAEEWGVPFCAGLIVGEAMLALIINGIVLWIG